MLRGDPRNPAESTTAGSNAKTCVADDYSAHSERMDGSEGSGWNSDRGNVPRTPGSAGQCEGESGAPETAGSVDEKLSTGQAL